MSPTFVTTLLAGTALAGISLWYLSTCFNSKVSLPPGPRGNLIFGSALELRTSKAFWINFAKWTDQFGPIISVRILFQRMIIVDDPKIVTYLFEKKASQYSDRYVSQLALLIGWETDIIFIEYGPLLKHYRTLLQRALNNRVVLDYLPLQEHETKRLLGRLYHSPEKFMQHIHLMAGSVAIRMVYGYKVDSPDDRLVQAAEQVMAIFSDIMAPARWMIEVFPLLRYVPKWFPGVTFHKAVASWVPILQATEEETFEFVKSQMAKGIAEPSFTSKLLEPENGQEISKEEEDNIKRVAASLYGAASDTTVSAVKTFFLAMTLYPDVQAKAQSEIDTFLQAQPHKQFITMDDRPNLPYTSALVREVLRWHPVLTLVGHRSNAEDDENVVVDDKTYRIPAQTVVIANVWKIMHNPEVYPDPERFVPERFISATPPPFPENYAFGFGRRICPGMHVAQQSMWLSISNILANFTITKAKDENGAEIVPEEDYTNDIISHPLPFKCRIQPRLGCEKWLAEIDL